MTSQERLINLSTKFKQELDADVELTTVMQDAHYAQLQKQKRLKAYGLLMDHIIDYKDYPTRTSRRAEDAHYVYDNVVSECTMKKLFKFNNQVVYQQENFYELKLNTIDYKNPIEISDDDYICPNCGEATTIGKIQNGCQKCGAKFSVDELFPKVSLYSWTIGNIANQKETRKQAFGMSKIPLFITGGIGTMIGLGIMFGGEFSFSSMMGGLIAGSFVAALGIPIGILIRQMNLGAKQMNRGFQALGQAFENIPALQAKSDYEKNMSRLNGEYSYEYISQKAVSLLQNLIFAEDVTDLPFYIGMPVGKHFYDIVDSASTGVVVARNMRIDQRNHCFVDVQCNMKDIVARNNQLSQVNEFFILELEKDLSIPIDKNFSIRALHCEGCASSYDSLRHRACPYCGRSAQLDYSDWIVRSVTRGSSPYQVSDEGGRRSISGALSELQRAKSMAASVQNSVGTPVYSQTEYAAKIDYNQDDYQKASLQNTDRQ